MILTSIRQYNISIASCFLLFFLSIIVTEGIQAQYPSHLQLEHITQEDGLSQSTGIEILQDQEGYMWFATQNGLNKYNGYEITVYQHDPQDSTSISGSSITALHEDSRGNIWIGISGSGLNMYDREKDSFNRYKIELTNHNKSINPYAVTDILEDSNGNLWIGSLDGLILFDREQEKFVRFYTENEDSTSISNSNISVLYEDERNNFWIGTNDGLYLWEEEAETFHPYRHDPSDPNSLSQNSITVIYEDKQQNLWIGTNGGGLNRFDREKDEFYTFQYNEQDPYSISGDNILSILEDSRGVLWVGTENEGLNIYDREENRFYYYKSDVSNPHSLLHNSIYSLYENRDNILWIGTFTGGISYMDRKYPKFEHYSHNPFAPNPLTNNSVVSFLETEAGTFLVGTDGGGLNIFDKTTGDFSPYRHDPDNPETLSSDVILALHQDSRGQIWIGYYSGGITRYDPETGDIQHYKHDPQDPNSLSNNNVYVIYEDSEGVLYFGTNGGGINRLEPGTEHFVRFGMENTPPTAPVIRAIYEDTFDNFWAGAYGDGALIMDKENGSVIHQFTEGDNGLTSNVIMAFHEDRQGNLWIGTVEGGLHLFDRESRTFKRWSVDDGLPSPVIQAILEDDHGNLWLSTLNGLSKFNPDDESFQNFNLEHGIQSNEFNPLAAYKDKNGYMYFGGINGFNRFHPDSITINTEVPPVVLTDFKIFNNSVPIGNESPLQKHISQTEKITLDYDASVLTFDFVTLNFNDNKRDRFAYMLEGFDNDWNYVEQQRSATYTNLDPGEYLFKIKAANSDGIWSEDVTSVALVITPPFWQTTLFYLLLILSVSGTIALVYTRRVRNITLQNRRLEKEVARQTAELSENNNELEKTLKELKNTRGELVEKAHKAGMADLATNVLHNVGNILNSVNVSINQIDKVINNSNLKKLKEANAILRNHTNDLDNFILNDPKGKALLQYYLKLEKPFDREYKELKTQKDRLANNVHLIIDVVASQQSYSKAGGVFERVSLDQVVEDTLKLQSGSIERHGMDIQTEFEDTYKVEVEKSKLIHSLVNILKNAKEAMSDNEIGEKKLTLRTWQDSNHVYLSATDTGTGISNEDIKKIFNHGFTTKSDGHGFGLHSCANYMQEIGGEIKVESKGEKQGTTFILQFPKISTSAEKRKRSGQKQQLIDAETE